MLCRWNTKASNLNLFISEVKTVAKRFKGSLEKTKGRPTKHKIEDYITLLVAKEKEEKDLRGAETAISRKVCGERVDHSVIGYWEQKQEMASLLKRVMAVIGKKLDKLLDRQFSVIDATKFSDWHHEETKFHLFNRICGDTVYPVGMSFKTGTLAEPTQESVPPGKGKLYGDAEYDNEDALKVMFEKGYTPVVCPNKGRWKGHYRKKARKIYNKWENRVGYKQRGRGESVFGSLTNDFGDRLQTQVCNSTKTRIVERLISYQVKILIRTKYGLMVIVRHAPIF